MKGIDLKKINLSQQNATAKIKRLCDQHNCSLDNFVITIISIAISKFTNEKKYILPALVNPEILHLKNIKQASHDYIPFLISIDYNLPAYKNVLKMQNIITLTKEQLFLLNENAKTKGNSINNFNATLVKINNPQDNINSKKLKSNISIVDSEFEKNEFKEKQFNECFLQNNLLINYKIDDTIFIFFDYNDTAFDNSLINNFVEQLERLFAWSTEKFEEKLYYFIPLTTKQQEYCLFEYNNTDKEFTGENNTSNIYNIFKNAANKFPNDIAIHYHGIDITYQQLEKHVLNMASMLYTKYNSLYPKRTLQNDAILICLDRNIELLIANLTVLCLNCSFVFVLPSFPQKRIEKIYNNSNAILMITDIKYAFKNSNIKFFNINEDYFLNDNLLLNINHFNLVNDEINNFAAHVYTSGSTGEPKGAKISHLQIINLLHSFSKGYSIKQNSKIMSVVEVVFDIFYMEYFLCLLNGATFVFCNTEVKNNPKLISEYIVATKPNLIEATLTYWSFINENLPKNISNCKASIVGEKINKKIYNDLNHFTKDIWGAYGITEITVFSTVYEVNKNNMCDIGKPISNTKFYVLDDELNIAPVGVNGILYISGIGLADGYINNEHLTKELFLQNHFIPRYINKQEEKDNFLLKSFKNSNLKMHSVLYKTNDVVRWNFDNTLEIIGRADDEVKIRGNRVNLAEIEKVLNNYSKIKKAVVCAKEYNNEKHIAVYFILKEPINHHNIKDELKQYLLKILPTYMLPSAYFVMENFPKTNTGKIDKKSLPNLQFKNLIYVENMVDNFKTTLEYKITMIWKKILGLENISKNDDFFEVGGHSLLAVKLANAINEELNLNLPVVWFYTHTTISSQFKDIIQNKSGNFFKPVVPLSKTSAKIKMFLIHTPIGGVEVYENLVKELEGNVECYGIDNYNLNSGNEFITNMEQLADLYIKYIKEEQTHGPYYLLGWSLGGNFALYIASKLQKRGEEVKKLYILDAYPINRISIAQLKKYEFFEPLQYASKIWDIFLPPDIAKMFQEIPQNYKEKVIKSVVNGFKMSVDCNTKKYPNDAMLIRATFASTVDLKYSKNSLYGWRRQFENLQIKEIDTNHFELMYGKNVKIIADHIINFLTVTETV